jgi:CubicO group peptidase (beta-lactamase class C family)
MNPLTRHGVPTESHKRSRVAIMMGLWLTIPFLPSHGASVDEIIAAEIKDHGIPGVSIAIIEKGEISKVKGYGFTDRAGTTPITADTLFQAGSVSKPVAALGVLRLVEDGRLALDVDVNRWLKHWQVPENEFTKEKKVTLRSLLSHSAGLTVHGFPGYSPSSRLPTTIQILDGLEPANTPAIRVDILPGSTWRYSGGGYTVMQQMMTDLTGKPFDEMMKEVVLTPLAMTSSTYEQPLPEGRVPFAATGYCSNGKAVEGKWHTYPEMAAAGLWTTPSDLARFAISIQQAATGKSNLIISQAMTREMLTVQKGSCGLGLFLEGSGESRRFSHGGRDEGFDTFMVACIESGQGFVVMINANDNTGSSMRIFQAVSKEYKWPQDKSSKE